ncbi:MAG: ATP-binding cassette domain-containing protein [Limnohabitans sp.]|nr:ATP-binding cassette domain-containing protein [Limnohabitans sp.]
MTGGSSTLKIENLIMVRGTKAVVHGIKLEIHPGKVSALLGPNGAGKTSTVLGIAGVVEPVFGDIWVDGINLKGLDSDVIRRHGIATVPEGHQVLRDLSVKENLQLAGGHLSGKALSQSIDRVLNLFPELKTRLQQNAGDLSGGQQQMVAISQALVVSPRFLLIDELSFGLAPSIVARLVPVIRDIAASGIGVLLIEQFTHLALALASHVYVMSRGKVSYDGDPGKLKADPAILHRAYFPISDREAVGLV